MAIGKTKNPEFNNRAEVLPYLCGLGGFVRVALATQFALLALAAGAATDWASFVLEFSDHALLAQPMLAVILLAACGARPWLERLAPWAAVAGTVIGAGVLAAAGAWAFNLVFPELAARSPWRSAAFAAALAGWAISYARLLDRARSPALAAARLDALIARIRPHFLFNSLNTVLSLIRTDPRQAETALEDLSELFRALMADSRKLVTLAEEIELARRYLAIEQLRLGERLRVVWVIDHCPQAARVPGLLLQPLVENAVRHGIESAGHGEVRIELFQTGDFIHIVVSNPVVPGRSRNEGNQMALDNISERLKLHYDLDASVTQQRRDGIHTVHIVLPCFL